MAEETNNPIEEAIEQALDLFLYAPLGLALVARDQLPALIERGRKQVAAQTSLARMMGQYAAKEGEKRIRKRVDEMTQRPAPATATPAAEAPATATEPAATPPAEPPAPKATGDHLAIPGYDALSASQVVQRLPGLQAEELEAVRAYEESTRGRRTILTKISQLQADG